MISSEEVGVVLARLAIADDDFLKTLLRAAESAESSLLPDDVEKLEKWARLMRILRVNIANTAETNKNTQE